MTFQFDVWYYDADYSTNQPHATRTIYKNFIWEYKLRIFAKMTQNSKSNTKPTYKFFRIFVCPVYLKISDYSQKYHYFLFVIFFLSKISILPYHPHLQVFTILFVSSIHQPPWTTKLKFLMHLKIMPFWHQSCCFKTSHVVCVLKWNVAFQFSGSLFRIDDTIDGGLHALTF